jgi:glycosyltransferase involved in cell wall biosynthesis
MRYVLRTRPKHSFGQHVVIDQIAKAFGYPIVDRAQYTSTQFNRQNEAALIIAHEVDTDAESKFINDLVSTPVVAHLHLRWDFMKSHEQNNVRKALESKKVRSVIVPSDFVKREYQKAYLRAEVDWKVVYSGADPTQFYPASTCERANFRRELHQAFDGKIPQDAFLGIVTGRVEVTKGASILARLGPLLRKRNIYLLVQYPAYDRSNSLYEKYSKIAQEIAEQSQGSIFPYPDRDRSLPRPIRFCDFSLSASLCELAPLVAIESLLAEVPIVVTNSTPFYGEAVKILGVPQTTLREVECLPRSLIGRPWNELTNPRLLKDHQLTKIGERLAFEIEKLEDWSRSSPNFHLPDKARSILSQGSMLEAFKAIYDDAANKISR